MVLCTTHAKKGTPPTAHSRFQWFNSIIHDCVLKVKSFSEARKNLLTMFGLPNSVWWWRGGLPLVVVGQSGRPTVRAADAQSQHLAARPSGWRLIRRPRASTSLRGPPAGGLSAAPLGAPKPLRMAESLSSN